MKFDMSAAWNEATRLMAANRDVLLIVAGVFFFQRNRISKEKARSEELLLNILPGPVAERLKQNEKNIADGFADPVVGFKDMPLTTTEWYCKGVGLVKLERTEPANSTFLAGGKTTLELLEWN